jgi:hypothetical protein
LVEEKDLPSISLPIVIKQKPHPIGVKLWSLVDQSQFLIACSMLKKVSETTT